VQSRYDGIILHSHRVLSNQMLSSNKLKYLENRV